MYKILTIILIIITNYFIVTASENQSSTLTAKSINVDQEQGIISAKGNVMIARGNRVLSADFVTYNKKTDIVTASGNVILKEPTGEFIFATYVELKGDLKDGFIHEAKMLTSDNAHLVSSYAQRISGEIMNFERVVYSPCSICKADPSKKPTWQIKSHYVVWDTNTKDLEHFDLFLEFFGVPVFYTPYLKHPDPTVERRSGFLTPIFGGSTETGASAIIPYYWSISSNKDLLLRPIIGSKATIIESQYRQIFNSGTIDFTFSLGKVKPISLPQSKKLSGKNKWHILGESKFNITKNWRTKLNVQRASDQTYTRRFAKQLNAPTTNFFTSSANLEGFHKRNYTNIRSIIFQDLRGTVNKNTNPLILPMIEYSYLSEPQSWGSRWSFDTNILSIKRKEKTNLQRLIVKGGWKLPYTSSTGIIYSLNTTLRGDIYKVNNLTNQSNKEISSTTSRLFPQISLDMQYPFIKHINDKNIIISPMITLIGAPKIRKHDKIPNEDSCIYELTDINLMDENRFMGFDIIDDGSRVNYGVNLSLLGTTTTPIYMFLGQSYHFQKPRSFLKGSGFGKKLSDYVINLFAPVNSEFLLRYRGRFNTKLKSKRNEISATIGKPILSLSTDYTFLPKQTNDSLEQGSHQIFVSLNSKFTKYWSANIGTNRELGKKGCTLSHNLNLTYQDDCFIFNTRIYRTFFKDRDIKPGTSFFFSLVFKNLGNYSYTFSPSPTTPTYVQ